MKRTLIATVLSMLVTVATAMLMAGVAGAQQPAPAKPATPTGGGRARPAAGATGTAAAPRVRNYDFDADFIDGELVRPEGEFLNARKPAEHGSLIRVRTDFIREIVKSAEDL